ncbi:MAG: hypothetical protein R3E50_08305 [Halioglobus sp.]
MPHMLLELQGLQECAPGPVKAHNGGIKRDPLTGEDILEDPCGRFTIPVAGKADSGEFDGAVYDLVNFLAYEAEPMVAGSTALVHTRYCSVRFYRIRLVARLVILERRTLIARNRWRGTGRAPSVSASFSDRFS